MNKENVTGGVTIKYKSNRVNKLNDNIIKGECLEYCISVALDEMDRQYTDYSHVYNFNGSGGKFVPDYLTDNYLIESKNWNCENYHINHVKAYNEIHKRRVNFLEYKPVLIISNPKWIKREKSWLLSCGWTIFELGYFVTLDNMDRAISDIKRFFKVLFGYVYTVPNCLNIISSLISNYLNVMCIDRVRRLLGSTLSHRYKILSKLKAIGSGLYGRIRKLKYLSKGDSKNKTHQSNKSKLQIKLIIKDSSRYPKDGKYVLPFGRTKEYYKKRLLMWITMIYENIEGVDKI